MSVMPCRVKKAWGYTTCIHYSNHMEVHLIEIAANGYSSRHYHEHKFNQFFVLTGKLLVHEYLPGKDNPRITHVLTAGMSEQLAPLCQHRFEAEEETFCLEIYWNDAIDPADILRQDVGGVRA